MTVSHQQKASAAEAACETNARNKHAFSLSRFQNNFQNNFDNISAVCEKALQRKCKKLNYSRNLTQYEQRVIMAVAL